MENGLHGVAGLHTSLSAGTELLPDASRRRFQPTPALLIAQAMLPVAGRARNPKWWIPSAKVIVAITWWHAPS